MTNLIPEPLFDRMIIELEKEDRKVGQLFVPADAEVPSCKVIAIGPGKYENGTFIATTLKAGDRVLVATGPNGVPTFMWDGKQYGLCREVECVVKLPPREDVDQATSRIIQLTDRLQ